jgi:hypothetical protein
MKFLANLPRGGTTAMPREGPAGTQAQWRRKQKACSFYTIEMIAKVIV